MQWEVSRFSETAVVAIEVAWEEALELQRPLQVMEDSAVSMCLGARMWFLKTWSPVRHCREVDPLRSGTEW